MAFPNIFALTRPGHVAPYLGSPFTPPWGHYSRSGEQEIMAKCFHPDKIAVRMKQSGRTEESLLLERDVHQWAFDALRSAQEEYSGSKKEKTDEQLLRTRAELEKRIGIELNLPTDDTSFHGSNRTQDIRLLVPLQYRLLATIWQDYLPGSRSQFWRYLEVLSQDMVVQLGKNPSISPMHVVRGSTVGHRLVPYNEFFFHHATWMWPPAWQLHVPTDDAYIGWPADDGEWRGEGDPSSGLGEDLQFWVSAAATSLTSRLLQEFKNTPRDLINAPKNLTGLVQRWFLSLESGEKRQPKKRCGSSTG